MSRSDSELLRRSAGGDRVAFETFVTRYQAPVYRYLLATTDSDSAEDALQETFIAIWRSASSFRGHDSARAWVFTIARHSLSRMHRRRVGEPSRFETLDDLDSLGHAAGWGLEQIEDFSTRLEDRDVLERAFRALAPDDREVLVLRELEGLSGEEMAALLAVSLSALKSRLHRARLRLAANLREVFDA